MYALMGSREYLRDLATGATHKTIYMPALNSFHVCLPDIHEQKRITSLAKAGLKQIEEARRAAEKQLQEISMLPQRLLQTAFGGS